VAVALLEEAAGRAECSLTEFTSARRARRAIVIIACVLAVCLVAMWFYSSSNDKKYLRKFKKMEQAMAAEDILSTILKHFSLESVNDVTFRGIKPKADRISVEFNDIRTEIPKSWSIVKGTQERKVLLSGVSGEFRPGRMAAIMGPSGAGKTTLLNVLCGKVKNGEWKVEGSVKINGEERDVSELKPVMGFVPQDDIVHEHLTVRENIRYSAELRCASGTTKKELDKITEDVLKVLQLEAQQNITVGNRTMGAGGLSGGQRKRVNIGLELAACPTLLFLDEPTSGLDSTTSLLLCSMLKKMTDLGMTIAMVIHQPRYGLFTLIDDVLLLGKGGRTAYVGPTNGAMEYFEGLGFTMPPNENPADWMMDILSGQNLPRENPRMPTRTLPQALFDAWDPKKSSRAVEAAVALRRSDTRGRFHDDQDSFDIIRHGVEEQWRKFRADTEPMDEEVFTHFLSECTGTDLRERAEGKEEVSYTEIVSDLMEQVSEGGDSLTVTREAFIAYLEAFRNRRAHNFYDSDGTTSDSSESDSEMGGDGGYLSRKPRGELDRVQPGFCVHLKVVMHRTLIQWWRRIAIRLGFLGVVEFAAFFMGFFDAVIFRNPQWMPTTILNVHVSVALLVSVYCLQLFSRDQAVYWREASHGLNRLAFLIGRTTVDTIDVLFICFFFTATYYALVLPELNFEIYFLPFWLVGAVASGWGYLISCTVPPILAPFVSAVLCFMVGGILGLPDKMTTFLDGGVLEVIADMFCFTRWSVPMDFLAYDLCGNLNITSYDFREQHEYTYFLQGYQQSHFQFNMRNSPWYTGMFALLCMCFVLRLATYPALRFINADKQR